MLCVQVVKGSEDHPSQYMNLMNVVFSAQKLGVVIDACILDNESGLLQQVLVYSVHRSSIYTFACDLW